LRELHRRAHVLHRLRKRFLPWLGQTVRHREHYVAALGEPGPEDAVVVEIGEAPSSAVNRDHEGKFPRPPRRIQLPFQRYAALDGRPERMQRLVTGAKKEGALTLYTSIPEKDMAALTADFHKRYGVKVNVWRASSVKVLQRAAAEARANRWDFDAAAISSPEMEAMHRELLLQEVRSGHHANLAPDAMPSHRAWVPQFLNVFVQEYNTSL